MIVFSLLGLTSEYVEPFIGISKALTGKKAEWHCARKDGL